RDSRCGIVFEYVPRAFEPFRGTRAHARMIVIENVDAAIILVSRAAHTRIARAEVAVSNVFRHCTGRVLGAANRFAVPGTILAMCSNDHPLLTKRMPSLLPFVWSVHSRKRPALSCVRLSSSHRVRLLHELQEENSCLLDAVSCNRLPV